MSIPKSFNMAARAAAWVGVLGLSAQVSLAVPPSSGATKMSQQTSSVRGADTVPVVRVIGVLHSAKLHQSRAVMQVNGASPSDYSEGDEVTGGWFVRNINSDAVAISDGHRQLRVPVEGGDAHPASRPAVANTSVMGSTSVAAAPWSPATASKQVLEGAARRRAIHNRLSE
jgi:hypothetical protein